MNTSRTFSKLLAAAARPLVKFIDSRGGTRSGKTYSALQLLILLAMSDTRPTITSVVSRALPHLKQGAIVDFKKIMIDEGLWDESAWNASSCFYTFPNGSVIEFFGVEATGKVYGPARDRLFMNEANFIKWETARQLIARTAGLVLYDYNPSAPFWGTEELPQTAAKDPRLHMEHVHSTYLDNRFLDPSMVAFIESFKGENNYWRVYGLGLMGQIEGQVFDFHIVDDLPDPAGFKEAWGMDFGFTNDPTTIIRVLYHTGRREAYADEICWRTGMTNPEIAAVLKASGIKAPGGGGPTVYADCAEPKSIKEIAGFGLDVKACDKKTAVREQVQSLQAWKLHITRRSINLADEGRKYMFKQLSNGDFTNEPVDAFNHGIDAYRYGLWTPIQSSWHGLIV